VTTNPSDRTCFPAADAPSTTDQVCECSVCNWHWASRGDDDKGCPACGAPASAIVVVSEAPDYGGQVVR